LQNSPEEEFETAIAEIHKIARLRLEAMEDE
jgi:2-oxo-4-hydroxy-4-carboxy--5-ureidoimidazoline (OHCU) decarboxylase